MFFVTQSWFRARGANYIQVFEMVKAFSDAFDDIHVCFRINNSMETEKMFPENINAHLVRTSRRRIPGWMYVFHVYFIWRNLVRIKPFSFTYSRSLIFTVMASFFGQRDHGLELHAGIRGRIEGSLIKLLQKRGVKLFCISHALKAHIVEYTGNDRNIYVVPDAHGFHVRSVLGLLREVCPGDPIRVGYFGSLLPHKGVAILDSMIMMANDQEIQFNVYSPDENRLTPSAALGDYCYLPHDQCASIMSEQDILVLLIEPQGGVSDISPFTSPLKLFEYMAAGKPIIASDLPILREVLIDGENAILVDNSPESFIEAILRLKKDRKLREFIAKNALDSARKRTWRCRVEKIISIFEGQQCS